MADPTLTVLVLLGLAAVVAGFVDAVVGGGGLIQLPALLIALPGAAPIQILATNKLSSICGTTVSAATTGGPTQRASTYTTGTTTATAKNAKA